MLSATGADAFLAREFNPGDLRNLWTLTPSGTVRFWSQWNKTSLPREPSTEPKAVEATLNPKCLTYRSGSKCRDHASPAFWLLSHFS